MFNIPEVLEGAHIPFGISTMNKGFHVRFNIGEWHRFRLRVRWNNKLIVKLLHWTVEDDAYQYAYEHGLEYPLNDGFDGKSYGAHFLPCAWPVKSQVDNHPYTKKEKAKVFRAQVKAGR